jgi:hypothetical protein
MNAVVHRTSRSRHWNAWGGSLSELERMGRTAQNLFDKRVDAYLDEIRTRPDDHTDLQLDTTSFPTEEDAVKSARKYIEFAATVTHGPDSSTGPLEDVLKELDRRSVTALKFRGRIGAYPYEHITLSVTWGRKENSDDEPGVDLHVETRELG